MNRSKENIMKSNLSFAAVLMVTILATTVSAREKTIVETAIAAGNFKTLVTAVKAAGLVDTLNGHKPFTVFAPTDEAFAKLDSSLLNSLLEPQNQSKLTQVLTYHVLENRVAARDAFDLNSATTVNGQRVPLNFRGDRLTIGDANVVVTDIQCSNGVIHVIDSVLIPELENIPTIAQSAGKFNTLLAAVGAAGLADVLSGPGPFTVFAPTDEAFAALPSGTVDNLLKPENKQQLVDILKYHVVSGRVYDADTVRAQRAKTLLGRSIDVGFSANGIQINDANVIARNVNASNGVIHIIDSVLIPKAMTRLSAMSYLSDAIERGAPIYNSGHHGQCCNIYMESMQALMSAGIEDADDHMMSVIRTTVNNAQNTHNQTDKAWVLRRGIDSVYTRLDRMPSNIQSMNR